MSESKSTFCKYTTIALVIVSVLFGGYCLFGVLGFNPLRFILRNDPVFIYNISEAEALNLLVVRYKPQFIFDPKMIDQGDTVACMATDAYATVQGAWNSTFFPTVQHDLNWYEIAIDYHGEDQENYFEEWFVLEQSTSGEHSAMGVSQDNNIMILKTYTEEVLIDYEFPVYKRTADTSMKYQDTVMWMKKPFHRVGVLRLQKIEYSY